MKWHLGQNNLLTMQDKENKTPTRNFEYINLCNFIEIALRHECSSVNLLHNFRTPFPKNKPDSIIFIPKEKKMNKSLAFLISFSKGLTAEGRKSSANLKKPTKY